MTNTISTQHWRIGPWRVFPDLNRLQNEQMERVLEPRVMAALTVLIDAKSAVVSDEQLLAGVWRGQIVSDASLYKVIAELRKALGDSDKPYQFIERVSGKGYRLLVMPEAITTPAAVPAPIATEETSTPAQTPVLATTNENPARENLWQSTDYDDAIKPGWSLGTLREQLGQRRSPLWLWAFVVIFVAVTLWQILPSPKKPPATPATTITANTIDPERRPDTIQQKEWDSFLQARWLVAQRQADALHEAVTQLQRVIDRAPRFTAAEVELCHAYHFLHLYSDWSLNKVMALCEPLLRHALQSDDASAAALAIYGSLKLSQGDKNAAAAYLDKSLTLAPDNAIALMWRSNLYREQGEISKALPLIERAAQRDPLSGIIKRSYAFTLINSGQIGQARQVFQEALLLEPNYSNRAIDELDMLPLTVERAHSFLQWAEKFPDRVRDANGPGPAINLALVNLSIGRLHEADLALKIAEQKYAKHPFTLLARAMWHSANRDPGAAQEKLQARAALQPNNPVYAVVALIFSNEKKPQRIRAEFEQWFPAFANNASSTVQSYLNNGQGQLVMLWLLTQSDSERQLYADTINSWLDSQTVPDNLSLNLHLLLGQTEQANTLALKMLNDGWLPSPNDDFYVAEHHPLWKALDSKVFDLIRVNQRKASTR